LSRCRDATSVQVVTIEGKRRYARKDGTPY